MLRRILLTTLAVLLMAAPGAVASPRAHSAAAERAEDSLEQTESLLDGRGVRTGRELTGALRELSTGLRHLRGEERTRAVSLLSRPTDSDAPDDERFVAPEVPPVCNTHFCVHSVASGADAPSAGMAALALAEAEAVRAAEIGTLGWADPPSDGDGRVDIYLKELGSQKLFGFAATDPGQDDISQYSYLVIDDDFDPEQYGGQSALDSLRVTLAHEFGHVLQYGYDVTADGWHYEASAVWLEHRVYPEIKDWLRFVEDRASGAGWASLTELPLTAFDHPDDQPRNAHPYGSVVWNQFLSARYGAAGDALQIATWANSDGLSQPSTRAHDAAIRDASGTGIESEFARFAAAAAEWGAAGSSFPSPDEMPDVERRGSLAVDGAPVAPSMDHLTFALYDVPATEAPTIRLAANFPAGVHGAVALVAREGRGGPVTTELAEAADGGPAGVGLDQPARFAGGRITAVIVNASDAHRGYNEAARDWSWRHDGQSIAARVSSSATGPGLTGRTPAPGATGVTTEPRISVVFAEPVVGVDDASFVLRGPNGRRVPAAVTYVGATRTAVLIPSAPLADTSRYTVLLSNSILNGAANALAQTEWTFTTVRRGPRAKVSATPGSFRLQSSDRDRLRWTASLWRRGRIVGTRTGSLRPGATRELRLPSGGSGRMRLVIDLADPQGNTKRVRRSVRRSG